jgi:hypothetical protein
MPSTWSLAEVDVRLGGASLSALLQRTYPARYRYADRWPHVSDTSHTPKTAHAQLRGNRASLAMARVALFAIDGDFSAVAVARRAAADRLHGRSSTWLELFAACEGRT